jgi:hypothetical protein
MNWSLIILGLIAVSSVAFAENSYLVIAPKLFKVGCENQISVFLAASSQPSEVKFDLVMGQRHMDSKITCKPGETRNVTLTLPREFPVGAGELFITGTGGIHFEEKRDIIVYDNRHVMLVQTSASAYYPGDTMEVRVVVTDESLMPIENGELLIEIYDASLKLVGEFPRIPIRSGLTETLRFPISEHVNVGKWLVSATMENTTSSVDILVSRPITPSFDLKAIFQRFLLRTDKTLRGSIEIDSDCNEPIFGHATIAIGQITEQEVESVMKTPPKPLEQESREEPRDEEWRKWKSQEVEIAGRIELNYDLLSLFNVDVTKALAVQVYIRVVCLASGQERVIRHVIPIFTRDVIYDIRPLHFEAGIKNEFEVIAKRPDGKPTKMEDMIVTLRMMIGDAQGKLQEEKLIEIKDFYTRGRNDIGFFNLEIPENCIGVLMTITPLGEDGKVRGYRTRAVTLMPRPRRRDGAKAKLSIELLPSTVAPVNTDVNVPVVSSHISTVGRTSNFYVQVIPSKSVEKFEPLPMSYVLMTNGRIIRSGEFNIESTKECRTKTARAIKPEEQKPLACVFNGTLPIQITRDMIPYSTLLVYTFQPSFGFHLAESYRFSVAGLFPTTFALNATLVPFTPTETIVDNVELWDKVMMKPITISNKVQDTTRVELSFNGVPDATVGLNVFEYDGLLQGLTNDITKERLIRQLTTYEHVPLVSMPAMPSTEQLHVMKTRGMPLTPPEVHSSEEHSSEEHGSHEREGWSTPKPEVMPPKRVGLNRPNKFESRRFDTEEEETKRMDRERMGHKFRYPIEQMIFGVVSPRTSPPVEGDDVYTTSNMGRLYGEEDSRRPSSSHYRRKLDKLTNQYDVVVGDNDFVIATSMPIVFTACGQPKPMLRKPEEERNNDMEIDNKEEPMREGHPQFGTSSWYERMNSKLSAISSEAFTFMRSGLTIVSDFDTLRVPTEMRRENLTKLFSRFHQHSKTLMDRESFDVRDEARVILEEYLVESGLSMIPPHVMLEEQSRVGYYRSMYFNTSRTESQGSGKVVLPRTKQWSSWVATGFALNAKSGLAIAQPIRLPTNQGLYVLGNIPQHVQVGERALLTFGINNYLGKDVNNVIFRIRASADFDLMEMSQPERIVSSNDKDWTFTIPLLKTWGVDIRNMTFVPKRAGIIQVVLEVESEFGGDYEILTIHVRESGIKRPVYVTRLFDLTSEKKTWGPIVEKITPSPFLRNVRIAVSSTGLDRFVEYYNWETNSLMGIDRALVRLYRSLALRRYLNETSQRDTNMFNMTTRNITRAYQKLQLYANFNGSYAFISDQGTPQSSLYLTSLAFGAMISPMMPWRDNVTLNRTLNWILSHQQEDGSFEDNGICLHYRYCSGEFRREQLTALVLYSLTRDNAVECMPTCFRHRLFDGENSPIARAQRYLESRVEAVKPHLLTISLFEMAFIQNRLITPQLREKIHQTLLGRQLTVVPEDGSKYLKNTDDKMTFDDQLLVNAMQVSLYDNFEDLKTATDIGRWVVSQIRSHPHYDTVLDAVFRTDAWIKTDSLYRKNFSSDKIAFTVDVTADNGQKQQFKVDGKNMDITQRFEFTLPVQQLTYTVNGFGFAFVRVEEIYIEKEQTTTEPMPFQMTQEFTPMSWFSEIKAKTCMTYTPTPRDQLLAKENFNRTIVVEVKVPSGMRLNLRQIGFFLSRVEEVMYFTYNERCDIIYFYINVPSTVYGKLICFEWCLERLSTIMSWTPIYVRVYDYLQQETQLVRLVPLQLQPSLLGWSYVEAVHKARPSRDKIPTIAPPPPPPPKV